MTSLYKKKYLELHLAQKSCVKLLVENGVEIPVDRAPVENFIAEAIQLGMQNWRPTRDSKCVMLRTKTQLNSMMGRFQEAVEKTIHQVSRWADLLKKTSIDDVLRSKFVMVVLLLPLVNCVDVWNGGLCTVAKAVWKSIVKPSGLISILWNKDICQWQRSKKGAEICKLWEGRLKKVTSSVMELEIDEYNEWFARPYDYVKDSLISMMVVCSQVKSMLEEVGDGFEFLSKEDQPTIRRGGVDNTLSVYREWYHSWVATIRAFVDLNRETLRCQNSLAVAAVNETLRLSEIAPSRENLEAIVGEFESSASGNDGSDNGSEDEEQNQESEANEEETEEDTGEEKNQESEGEEEETEEDAGEEKGGEDFERDGDSVTEEDAFALIETFCDEMENKDPQDSGSNGIIPERKVTAKGKPKKTEAELYPTIAESSIPKQQRVSKKKVKDAITGHFVSVSLTGDCRQKTLPQVGVDEKAIFCPYCDAARVIGSGTKDYDSIIVLPPEPGQEGGRCIIDASIEQLAVRRTPNYKKFKKEHLVHCVYLNCIKGKPDEERKYKRDPGYIEKYYPVMYKQKKIKYDQALTKTIGGKLDHAYYKAEREKRRREEIRSEVEQEIKERMAKQKRKADYFDDDVERRVSQKLAQWRKKFKAENEARVQREIEREKEVLREENRKIIAEERTRLRVELEKEIRAQLASGTVTSVPVVRKGLEP